MSGAPGPWPSRSAFAEALQHPMIHLTDERLRAMTVVSGAMGMPLVRTGGNGVVFRLEDDE